MTTMKRILYRMLRYVDAIVKRGVDKLIDAIEYSPEPQTKNAETPQPQKRMRNDTDCASQTTDNTSNCGLTKQAFTLMDEQCDMRFLLYDDMRKLPIAWHYAHAIGSYPYWYGYVSLSVCQTDVVNPQGVAYCTNVCATMARIKLKYNVRRNFVSSSPTYLAYGHHSAL